MAGSFLQDEKAEIASGFSQPFIKILKKLSQLTKTHIAIRSGQAPNLDKGFEVSPKPMTIKTKTFTDAQGIPFLSGFIPINQAHFGRAGAEIDPDTHLPYIDIAKHTIEKLEQKEFEHHSGIVSDSIFGPKTLESTRVGSLPLSVRLKDIKGNPLYSEFTLSADGQYHEFHLLQPIANAAYALADLDRSQLTFRIPITKGKEADDLLPLFYSLTPEEPDSFQALQVMSYDQAPVTGDADMFAIAPPLEEIRYLQALCEGVSIHTAYDTQRTADCDILTTIYARLYLHYFNVNATFELIEQLQNKILDNIALKTAGRITPYELFIMFQANEMGQNYYIGGDKIFRHGAETNNPGTPSPFGPTTHFVDGAIYQTETAEQLRDFYLTPGLLNENFLPIPPTWLETKGLDGSSVLDPLWMPLVEKQIFEYGQLDLVNPSTVLKLRDYYLASDDALSHLSISIPEWPEWEAVREKQSALKQDMPEVKRESNSTLSIFTQLRVSPQRSYDLEENKPETPIEPEKTAPPDEQEEFRSTMRFKR